MKENTKPKKIQGKSQSVISKLVIGFVGLILVLIVSVVLRPHPSQLSFLESANANIGVGDTGLQGLTKGVAIIGDSLSDEYRADGSRGGTYGATTFNWMEVLVNKRTIDFGPWGSWGGARRSGYKYNWALSGMTTSGLISYNVGAGIAQQVTAGEVGNVLIQIGTDDFAPQLNSFFNDIYNGTISDADLESTLDTMAGRVSSTIDTIRAAGDVKIVLSTAIEADIPRVPLPDAEKQAYLTQYPDPVKRQRVLDATIGYNQRLRNLAQTRTIPVFEGSEYFLTTVPSRFDANGFFNVGGELIDGKTRGNEPHHLLLDDTWFHPGTVASGQFANAMFIEMFNQNFQTNIAPLTDQEILQAAGISTSPSPTSTPTPTVTPTPTPIPPTPTPAPDITAPNVNITNPLNGTTVRRNTTVVISANASDNVAVGRVEFYVNNILKCTDIESNYTCGWIVPSKNRVTYTIRADAYDTSGNYSSDTSVVQSR